MNEVNRIVESLSLCELRIWRQMGGGMSANQRHRLAADDEIERLKLLMYAADERAIERDAVSREHVRRKTA